MTTINLHKPATLGALLGITRTLLDIDQTEMGKRIGVSRPTISAWERGSREPSFSQVVAWARITGQPIDAFVEALNAETAPAEAEAVDVVRPKGFEPLTFWLGVVRRRLSSRRDDDDDAHSRAVRRTSALGGFWNAERFSVLEALDDEMPSTLTAARDRGVISLGQD